MNLKERLWIGVFKKDSEKSSIVVFDRRFSISHHGVVELFHKEEDRFQLHKVNDVKPYLRPISNTDQVDFDAVASKYFEAKSRRELKSALEKDAPRSGLTPNCAYEDEVSRNLSMLVDEIYDDQEAWARSDEEGWYYED